MSRRAPSFARRLLLGFVMSSLVLGACLFAGTFWMVRSPYMPAELAADAAAEALARGADGRLRLEQRGEFADLTQRNPGLWVLATDRRGRIIVQGAPPPEARRLLGGASGLRLRTESRLNFATAGPAPLNRGHLVQAETRAGPAMVLAGGVDPRLSVVHLTAYALTIALLALVPALIVLGLFTWLVIAPLVLRGLRPLTVAAAAIDGSDPRRRLPEADVPRELMPIVRAFNGALTRLEDVLERRRRFIADAAHELRTPLAVITLHAEALPEGGAKHEIQRGLFRLSEMVGQMLDNERLQAGGGRCERFDLAALARAAVADVAPLAVEAGYEVSFAAEREPVPVDGDQHAVRRALNNLLGNAVAHGGGGGVIDVRVGADASVEVNDQGPGVEPEARQRVFEPFHRERWDRDGCGLGLHLVREIMRAHGGSAEVVDGAPGARFRLRFPSGAEAA